MGRLIDADALLEHIEKLECHAENKKYEQGLNDCLQCYFPQIINNQPTAYDVEKVLAVLEKEMVRAEEWVREEMGRDGNELNFEHYVGERNAYMDAMTIVRNGGKE